MDILINNAALAEEKVPFMKASYSDILQMINTDLISVMVCSQYAVKIMQKQGSGKIINTSSVRGIDYMGTVGTVVYSSAKAGVSSFTKTLAKLVAPTIHVNAIAPGYVKTRGYDGLTKKELNRRIQLTQLKRFIRTEEIADAFVFLAKNDAMTGQIISVDAGLTLK